VLLVPPLPCRGVHLRPIDRADRASDPAVCADRYWVGGLLGGLDGAPYIATVRPLVRPVTTSPVCFAPDSLDKSKSYQRPALTRGRARLHNGRRVQRLLDRVSSWYDKSSYRHAQDKSGVDSGC
jgi:hypothetical protein